ncbi:MULTISPECIES: DNA topoisomerase III [Pseudoalteromonas]|jgi:DNA topoisomerase-3|uniref:DNA topoisomerase III n=1 Tax=Pseudoalteromonas TaxID=53246 RepID=UPI000825DAC9|nr:MULTISPECIES: DNA topoisomerase III [Pseudoalteromonas]MCC9660194.1 DNA topoisomerase III [Pseudoalteromonas sp. MB41]QLJ07582.1 DNA topoisomerase III [Pseudoalteromonas sp. JSTW]QPL42201.1 DNA topoisomerase III [Pseudoalteromonas sp. A41-2]
MKLYIAEKPSLARAIADALPKPQKKQDGFIELANGDCVSWCIGHLLEQAEPDEYDERFKKWRFEHLPIVPEQWQLKPKPKTRKQLTVLKKLIKQATQIVHAGDPDREGQLLVDQVIDQVKLSQAKKQQIQRLLISDLNLNAVKKALNNLRSNREFIPLSVSALARSRADWLFGMNLTRAYTLAGQKAGFGNVLSVGRVQTPILGLVVNRDNEIANFTAKPFYEVLAHLKTQNQQTFTAKWQPSKACEPYQDDEGRVLHRGLAENVVSRITDQPATVSELEQKQKKQQAPLPYNLSALQIDAAKAFSMPAQSVLDICQNLYERHKLITYPRSDNRYLPKDHHREAAGIIAAIAHNDGQPNEACNKADSSKRSKCFNDSKVAAHHAIVPTVKQLRTAALNADEQKVYRLICRQYLAQFYPDYIFNETKVSVMIAGGLFKTTAKQDVSLGFKALMGKTELKDEQTLPPLEKGQQLHCYEAQLVDKMTSPPAHFTDATLLSAMTGISRYVKDSEIKKILKETDGLGTEATRAGIIELLFKRRFLKRQGKSIIATETGQALISALPLALASPDLTAKWEASLSNIAEQQMSYQQFLTPLLDELQQLVEQAKHCDSQVFAQLPKTPPKRRFKRKAKSKAKPA